MRLESVDGPFVELTISSYQFGRGSEPGDWDANWLQIQGVMGDGDQTWEFRDPCLTTWEAGELAGWLRGLANANPGTVEQSHDEQAQADLRLEFTEPNLSFELAGISEGLVTMYVDCAAESGPPQCSCAVGGEIGHRITLRLPAESVIRAADQWNRERSHFPVR